MQRLPDIATGRPAPKATAVVAGSGAAAAALSLLTVAVEPSGIQVSGRAAGVAFSLMLLPLFIVVWLVDAWIVDAVAQLMSRPARRRRYLVTSAYAFPVLCAFEVVRIVQAAIDRAGGEVAQGTATAVGFVDFAVIAWFVGLLTLAVRAVYALPTLPALAAALSPSAAMATVLFVVLVIGSVLHASGVM